MRNIVLLAFLGVGAASCTYETLTVAESDLAWTVRDPGRDYAPYKTYAVSDTVQDLCGVAKPRPGGLGGALGLGGTSGDYELDSANCSTFPHVSDQTIFTAIDRNMKARGYKKVASLDDKPELVILVGTVVSSDWYYQPGYVWCDPYYYYSCWYPAGGYYYEISTGSILINMVDASESTTSEMSSVWFAALNGLYSTSSEKTGAERINDMVDRAFSQSTYLQAGTK